MVLMISGNSFYARSRLLMLSASIESAFVTAASTALSESSNSFLSYLLLLFKGITLCFL